MAEIKTCSKCLMPETETLVFDKDNTCSVCNQIQFKKKVDWENEIKILIIF